MKHAHIRLKDLYENMSSGWKGALFGLIIAVGLFWIWAAYHYFPAEPRWLSTLFWSLVGFILTAVYGLVLALIVWLLSRLPRLYLIAATAAVFLLLYSIWNPSSGQVSFLLQLGLITIGAALLGAGVVNLAGRPTSHSARGQSKFWIISLLAGAVMVGIFLIWLFIPGSENPYFQNINAASLSPASSLTIPDPTAPGAYPVLFLTYGSGQDRRNDYGDQATIITPRVDGSNLVSAWEAQRSRYWGFDHTALPLNGRIFYPRGEGPFPLALLVHGNHPMEIRSELGFDYLCELLASRGYICSSIDENFFNVSSINLFSKMIGISIATPIGDNQARAWLALEHLKLYRQWQSDPANPLFGMIDMNHIALIGHSMGGEAVAIASAFNWMPYFYDSGTQAFDYGFAIRTVIALAPVDNFYTLGGNGIQLEDTNYLVLHGSTDSDVYSFLGLGQYERTRISGEAPGVKSSLYIDKANHSQFNSQWGSYDLYLPAVLLQNNKQTMSVEAQQQITKVYLSAFLDLTIRNDPVFLPLFSDPRSANNWLPDTIYLNQLQASTFQPISNFEEDANLQSTTISGGQISQERIISWSERALQGKITLASHDSHAVFIGWDEPGTYSISLPPAGLNIMPDTILTFSLADAAEDPNSQTALKPERAARQPIDLTIELADSDGDKARVSLSDYLYLQPQVRVLLSKIRVPTQIPASELVPQSYFIPLQDFIKSNPDFDPIKLAEIHFIFDRTPSGVIVIDNLGLQSTEAK